MSFVPATFEPRFSPFDAIRLHSLCLVKVRAATFNPVATAFVRRSFALTTRGITRLTLCRALIFTSRYVTPH